MFHPDIPYVEERIKEFVNEAEDNEVIHASLVYSAGSGGKKVRPSLTLFCADLFENEVSADISDGKRKLSPLRDKVISSAACVELMHTASLIIDDVVDNSDTRRGKPSLNAVFGNKIAVVSASFLLGVISHRLSEVGSIKLIRRFSETAKEMAKGEILEFRIMAENLSYPDKNEILADYFEVIKKKTAYLFSLSASIPPLIYTGEDRKIFSEFGFKVGVLFQLKDDILDFVSDKTGKPPLKDVREGKITLPILLSDNFEDIFHLMRDNIEGEEIKSDEVCNLIKKLVEEGGGIERAEKKLQDVEKEVSGTVEKIDAPPDKKEKLLNFVRFVSSRNF